MTNIKQRILAVWQRILALLQAALLTTALASLAHSLFVQAGLVEVGAKIPLAARVVAILRDFMGLLPTLGLLLLLALGIGFAVAGLLKPRLPLLAPFAYPLAGFVAVATALIAMRLASGLTPIAGARTTAGFLAISLAGLAGGLLFALLRRRPA